MATPPPVPRTRLLVVAGALAALVVLLLVVWRLGDDGEDSTATGTSTTSEVTATSTSATATTSSSTTATTAPAATLPPPPPPDSSVPGVDSATQIRAGRTDQRVVALTFDAGSDRGAAGEILDVLADEGVAATFGLTGRWADANPDLVRRIVADGHQVLNHSWDHPSFTGRSTGTGPLSMADRLDQLRRTEAALTGLGVDPRPWFRPPYGDTDESVDRDLAAAGYRYDVLWTVDSLGWRGIPPDEVTRRVLDGAGPGAIVLLHVGEASTDVDALPSIIAGLRDDGYGFATVADAVG